MTTITDSIIKKIKIEDTDIFLEEIEENKGKITISNTWGKNYSMYWGSMGGTLEVFLTKINEEYFADKLLGVRSTQVFDVNKTFTELRKYIRTELYLPWYKHLEFQKDMREILKIYQQECEDMRTEEHFYYCFKSSFINRLNFYLIEDKYDRKDIENDFNNIEEWQLIMKKDSEEYIWLKNLHKKIKKHLQI